MNDDLENVRRLAAELRENLAKSAADPGEDPVHDTRTGTRRLEATVENIVRELPERDGSEELQQAAKRLLRTLKKLRRAAGPVRDLDVHRKLLERLAEKTAGWANPNPGEVPLSQALPDSDGNTACRTHLQRQAAILDDWLRQHRSRLASELSRQAEKSGSRLEQRVADLEAAMTQDSAQRTQGAGRPPALLALESFARLAADMPHLHADNLHDFRKGAKKARYIAELAADPQAEQVAKALKKLQDEIGDWHDWLVLAQEAEKALGDSGAELAQLIQSRRDEHFVSAMKAAEKLRGRLMGEWLAQSSAPGHAAPGRKPPRPDHRHPREQVA